MKWLKLTGWIWQKKVKDISPNTDIIFLAESEKFAFEAFSVRALGYLLKPVSKEALENEINYVLSRKPVNKEKKVKIKTFGSFEVYVNEKQVKFHMAKCKEILAYLVDIQGDSATRAEIAAVLWEDRIYDRKLQKQLDVYIRSLRKTLEEYGIADIFEMKRATLRIIPEKFECDVYKFFLGDADAVKEYRGEYMRAYSWASITEGTLYSHQNNSFLGLIK